MIDPSVIELTRTFQEIGPDVVVFLIAIYLSIGWFSIEGAYELIKVILEKIFKVQPTVETKIQILEENRRINLERAANSNDPELKRTYENLGHQNLQDIEKTVRKKTDLNWLNIVFPAGLGLVYALGMYPFTIFTLLPFRPPFLWIEILIMGLICFRGSNLAHGAPNKVGSFFEGLIGRVSGVMRF